MLDESDTPKPDDSPEPVGDPPTPLRPPEGTSPLVKDKTSDELTKEGDAGDKLGDFA